MKSDTLVSSLKMRLIPLEFFLGEIIDLRIYSAWTYSCNLLLSSQTSLTMCFGGNETLALSELAGPKD